MRRSTFEPGAPAAPSVRSASSSDVLGTATAATSDDGRRRRRNTNAAALGQGLGKPLGNGMFRDRVGEDWTTGHWTMLNEIAQVMFDRVDSDLFSTLAHVLRRKAGRLEQQHDIAWDHLLRIKELHIFIFSMIGVAASVAIATATWYFGDQQSVALAALTRTQQAVMYLLQVALTASTLTCILLLIQKYDMLLEEKRREWSSLGTYTMVRLALDNGARSKPWWERVRAYFVWNADILQQQRHHVEAYSFWNSGLRWKALAEIVVHLIHPVVWLDGEGNRQTGYNILQCVVFVRFYLLASIIYIWSAQYKERHEIISSNEELQRMGFRLNIGSTMKMLFYERPLIASLLSMSATLMIFGFIVFLIERTADGGDTPFTGLQNSIWFGFVTFTSVGYGDMAPVSFFGRVAAIMIGAAGITATTVLGGVLTNVMVPSREQRLVTDFLVKQDVSSSHEHYAAKVIQMAFRAFRQQQKHIMMPWVARGHKSNVLYAAIKDFRRTRWNVSQARSSANDPVTDAKMRSLHTSLRSAMRHMEEKSKRSTEARSKVALVFKDIEEKIAGVDAEPGEDGRWRQSQSRASGSVDPTFLDTASWDS